MRGNNAPSLMEYLEGNEETSARPGARGIGTDWPLEHVAPLQPRFLIESEISVYGL